jgi:hypothetical protein
MSIWDYPRRSTIRGITLLSALLLALLACCTNTILPNRCPPTNLPDSTRPSGTIYAKLQESAPQGLIIHNQMSTPVRLVAQRSRQAVQLEPSSSIEIFFRVLSIGSFEKVAGQPYYVQTAAVPTNHLEEIDHLGLIYVSSRAPEIRYHDQNGHEHVIAFDLNNCGANSGWGDTHWSQADHSGQLPSPIAGVPQTLCPTR